MLTRHSSVDAVVSLSSLYETSGVARWHPRPAQANQNRASPWALSWPPQPPRDEIISHSDTTRIRVSNMPTHSERFWQKQQEFHKIYCLLWRFPFSFIWKCWSQTYFRPDPYLFLLWFYLIRCSPNTMTRYWCYSNTMTLLCNGSQTGGRERPTEFWVIWTSLETFIQTVK